MLLAPRFSCVLASEAALTHYILFGILFGVCEGFRVFVLRLCAQLRPSKGSLDLSVYLDTKTAVCGLTYLDRKLNDLSTHPC